MQRIIIIVAVLYLLWRVLAAVGRRSATTGRGAEDFSRFSGRSRDRRREAKDRQKTGVELVACQQCGTLVPSDRLLTSGNGVFCCSEPCLVAHENRTESTAS